MVVKPLQAGSVKLHWRFFYNLLPTCHLAQRQTSYMPPKPTATERPQADSQSRPANNLWRLLGVFFTWAIGLSTAGLLTILLLVGVALVMAYPQLPDISDLADYRPKLSMRVFSVEGKVIGEFGEERRKLVPFKDIPVIVKQAVLSIEDARFYQHGGVDYMGVLRAALHNATGSGARQPGQRRARQKPGRVHHHHASGAQCVFVVRENLYPQNLRTAADL